MFLFLRYPFSEDLINATKYMESRCPAWCDRIVLNKNMLDSISSNPGVSPAIYDMIGEHGCMGDHKARTI